MNDEQDLFGTRECCRECGICRDEVRYPNRRGAMRCPAPHPHPRWCECRRCLRHRARPPRDNGGEAKCDLVSFVGNASARDKRINSLICAGGMPRLMARGFRIEPDGRVRLLPQRVQAA